MSGGERGSPSEHGVVPGLQYLRGAAVLMVVVAHVNSMMRYPEAFGASMFNLEGFGRFGVAVFFGISGFIIAASSLDTDLRPKLDWKDYARRRFLRIVPFLWVCVLGYNLVALLGTGVVEVGPAVRAMLVWPVGEFKPNVVWSLRHELLFYGIFAACFLTRKRRIWPMLAWVLSPIIVHAMMIAPDAAHIVNADAGLQLIWMALGGSYGGANLQFGVGLLLGCLWLRSGDGWHTANPGPVGVYLLSALAYVASIYLNVGGPLAYTAFAGLPLLVAIVTPGSRGPVHRLGMLLGNASYSIYLTHNLVVMVGIKLVHHFRGIGAANFLLLTIVVAVAAGILVHLFVEQPLRRWLVSFRLLRRAKGVLPQLR